MRLDPETSARSEGYDEGVKQTLEWVKEQINKVDISNCVHNIINANSDEDIDDAVTGIRIRYLQAVKESVE